MARVKLASVCLDLIKAPNHLAAEINKAEAEEKTAFKNTKIQSKYDQRRFFKSITSKHVVAPSHFITQPTSRGKRKR